MLRLKIHIQCAASIKSTTQIQPQHQIQHKKHDIPQQAYGYTQIQESHIKELNDNIQGHQHNKHETRACNDSVFSPLEKVATTMQSGPAINSGNFILPPYNEHVANFQELQPRIHTDLQFIPVTGSAPDTPPNPALSINGGHYILPAQCQSTKNVYFPNEKPRVCTNNINPINCGHYILPAQCQSTKNVHFQNEKPRVCVNNINPDKSFACSCHNPNLVFPPPVISSLLSPGKNQIGRLAILGSNQEHVTSALRSPNM